MNYLRKKDEIALEVQKQVAEEMSTYGYIIVKTLITKVEPDAEVKQSMNEINAAQRKRVAAQELAEADKIKIVTAAEAEAEKKTVCTGLVLPSNGRPLSMDWQTLLKS